MKIALVKDRSGAIQLYSFRNKGVHNIPKGISPKVNRIVRLEFELTYYDDAVQHVSHNDMNILLLLFGRVLLPGFVPKSTLPPSLFPSLLYLEAFN